MPVPQLRAPDAIDNQEMRPPETAIRARSCLGLPQAVRSAQRRVRSQIVLPPRAAR